MYVCKYVCIPEKTESCIEVRLNSPRGKFKITNMADDQVDLTRENGGEYWTKLLLDRTIRFIASNLPVYRLIVPGMLLCRTR